MKTFSSKLSSNNSTLSPRFKYSKSIKYLRDHLIMNSRERNSIDPIQLALSINQAVKAIKEEAIHMMTSQLGYKRNDTLLLWDAAEHFLQGLPSLVNFHEQLTKFENDSRPRSLWKHSMQLEPRGTILVCLPANAVIPLSIILPAALSASGNQVIFAVSNKSREVGSLIIETLRPILNSQIHFWNGGVREVVEGLTYEDPVIDALYYMGSSKQFATFSQKCADSGVSLLYEGEARGIVIIDDTIAGNDLEDAVEKIVAAKKFCFGQMCSAPNVVLIADNLFEVFVATYHAKCLAHPLGSPLVDVLSESTLETVSRLNSKFGKGMPALDCKNKSYPFFWTATVDDALNEAELFCPGIILVSVPNVEMCFRAMSKLRFRMQVSLFSNEPNRLNVLISNTHFARYCSWMNPADQDALLPWGNYGCSGSSDVLDFYRKGLQRIIIESN